MTIELAKSDVATKNIQDLKQMSDGGELWTFFISI